MDELFEDAVITLRIGVRQGASGSMFPEAEVDYLIDFYTKRLKWLDTELHKL